MMISCYDMQDTTKEQDKTLERKLSPKSLDEFIGHQDITKRLKIFIQAAKKREDILGHTLFCGPPGLGKTSLAHILAKEMNTNIVVTSGPILEKIGDLAGILTGLDEGDILFIDEVHRLNKNIEEYLYPALENFTLDLTLDSGPNAKSVQISLNPFTLVTATTKPGALSAPLRSRFLFTARLDFYDYTSLSTIISCNAKKIGVHIDEKAAMLLAHRARGTPRTANNLLRWMRDVAIVQNSNTINTKIIEDGSKMIGIDKIGLEEMDVRILRLIHETFNGGPVGLNSICASLSEDQDTISLVHEPYLISKGLIKRGARGREITPSGIKHLELVC